jgi:hypothetical protein
MPVAENGKSPEEHDSNSPPIIDKRRVISYNLSEGERPDGIKVRYKIRIATGKRARDIDARQAAVIMEVLQWAAQHPNS